MIFNTNSTRGHTGSLLVKAKVGCLYGRSNILLRKFYFCSERVQNRLFSSYCSNLYLCSLWANYRKSSISRFIVSYNNAFKMLHNLHMRCSASSMFANAVVDSCSTWIRKSMFSLMSRLNTSINVIVQSTVLWTVMCIPLRNYTKYGLRRYTVETHLTVTSLVRKPPHYSHPGSVPNGLPQWK